MRDQNNFKGNEEVFSGLAHQIADKLVGIISVQWLEVKARMPLMGDMKEKY